eukprot:m.203339 g.203339  ORF g.203339 m.203339 type:complete len:94 (-) comp10691_c0_seq43:3151-3432(-)
MSLREAIATLPSALSACALQSFAPLQRPATLSAAVLPQSGARAWQAATGAAPSVPDSASAPAWSATKGSESSSKWGMFLSTEPDEDEDGLDDP